MRTLGSPKGGMSGARSAGRCGDANSRPSGWSDWKSILTRLRNAIDWRSISDTKRTSFEVRLRWRSTAIPTRESRTSRNEPIPVEHIRQHALVPGRDDGAIDRLHRWLLKGLDDYVGLWQLIRAVGDER